MVELKIDDTHPVLVEFTPRPGVQKVALSSADIVKRSAEALDAAMGTIHNMALRAVHVADGLSQPPSEIALEFGIKLDAEAGAIVAKASVEGSFVVKLSWHTK